MSGPAFVRRSVALAVAAVCALGAAASSAAATTIGQTPTPTVSCSFPGAPGTFIAVDDTVPGPGQITNFSFHSSPGNSGNVDFYVFRPTPTFGTYTVVGDSGPVPMLSADQVQTFTLPSPILVLPGDQIGLYYPSTATVDKCEFSSGSDATNFKSGPASAPAAGDTLVTDGTFGGGLSVSAEFTPSTPLPTNSATPAAGPVLESGVPYAITIRGTYSAYTPDLMSGAIFKWVVCGSPEPAPEFGTATDAVGQDAERIFAMPRKKSCPATFVLPHIYKASNPAVLFDIGDAAGFHHIAPTDGTFHADHSYTYVVTGQGQPLQVKLLDTQYNDNYGELEIDVAPISE